MEHDFHELQRRYPNVGAHIIDGIMRYCDTHQPVGGFLTAVLSNDLRKACATADEWNALALPDIVRLLYNEAPSKAWGSPEKVAEWLKGWAQ